MNNDARTFVAWAGNLYAHDEHPTSVLELAIRRDAVHVLERIRFPETVRRQHVYVSACSFKVRHWIAMPGTYRNTRNYRTMLYAATVAGPTKFNEHDLPSPWHRLDANMHLDRTDQWYLVKQTMEDLHTGIERARVFGAQMFIKMWRRETPTYDDATRILCRRALKGLKPATRSPQLDLKANQLYTCEQARHLHPGTPIFLDHANPRPSLRSICHAAPRIVFPFFWTTRTPAPARSPTRLPHVCERGSAVRAGSRRRSGGRRGSTGGAARPSASASRR